MQAAATINERSETMESTMPVCYHCGTTCFSQDIKISDRFFFCDGCKLVYQLLSDNNLCDYYHLQSHPGLAQIKPVRNDKYSFLDNETISSKLYRFNNEDLSIVTLYIPAIHCSSCMWLLEHLGRLDTGITESRINFTSKEVTIHFSPKQTKLRSVVELLATIGYEPYISMDDAEDTKAAGNLNKQRIIKLGVAGFCFGNIMMMSFPEYLSGKTGIESQYTHLFRYLNLLLSLPVVFYCATEFYTAAWKGLQQKILNIDAPIVFALFITFARSIYEIAGNTGAGYLDSMSGIVFFMLVGRVVQERTYKSLSFTRDYKSYLPIAVNVHGPEGIVSTRLQDLKKDDIVVLHNGEIVPADALVLNQNAMIDYSFVTGEAQPVSIKQNELVYAGGKQTGKELMIRIVKPIAGSYLTSLWNHYAFSKNKPAANDKNSTIHLLSRYFTTLLLLLAAGTALFWYYHDPSRIITSISAMLIVACPCALLLAATFTNSNIVRILSLNGLYLRDATVIEQIAQADHIVFDKTGTITNGQNTEISCTQKLTTEEKAIIYSVARQSNHPNSLALAKWLGTATALPLDWWNEIPGKGVEANIGSHIILLGSAAFTGSIEQYEHGRQASVYVKLNNRIIPFFLLTDLRAAIPNVITSLNKKYTISLLSGDNDRQKEQLKMLFKGRSEMLFDQKPIDKLKYIEHLQTCGRKVIMIGDGLNDAGALQQSNVGITITEDINNFTPACDAIFNAGNLPVLPGLLQLARQSARVIRISFIISLLYNITGLYFAMSGQLRPVVAAILMPCSTLSIVIVSAGLTNYMAWRKGLTVKSV